MLLNIGDVSSTMITIVFTSMEEAVMRAFLVEIDTYIRKIMGKPKLHGRTLELQRFVWSIDINQSSIAEFVAIIVSSFAYVLLEPHALAINLGYKHGEALLGGLAFVQLMLELLLEGFVDTAALWAESEHGIPIGAYFQYSDSIYTWIFHQSWCDFCTLFLSLYAFARFPTILSCSSDFICDCIDQPVYFEWFNDTCASLPANITFAAQNTSASIIADSNSSSYLEPSTILDAIDISAILTTIVAFIGVASLIYFAIFFFRHKKGRARVMNIKETIERLDAKFNAEIQSIVGRIMAIDGSDNDSPLVAYNVPRDHVTMTERIGKGARGEVWVGMCNGTTVAIKKMYVSDVKDKDAIESFKRECEIMAELQKNGASHPNIVQMLYCCWTSSLMLMLEYHPLGSLREVLDLEVLTPGAHGKILKWVDGDGTDGVLSKLALDVCSGLDYLHGRNICHRDVKPGNILVTGKHDDVPSAWGGCLSDFGEAMELSNPRRLNQAGTALYMAPELFKSENMSVGADAYALGMTLLDMAACVEGSDLAAQWPESFSVSILIEGRRPRLTPTLEQGQRLEWLGRIIVDCWADDPLKRPTAAIIAERFRSRLSNV